MILTRSPYYLTIPWNDPESVESSDIYFLQLFIWQGEKNQELENPTYEIENKNPLQRVGNSEVNISNYINDFLQISLHSNSTTNIYNANNATWVKSQVVYIRNGNVQGIRLESIDLAIKGYGYGIEGKNADIPSNNSLTSGFSVNVSLNSVFNTSIKVSETNATNLTIVSHPNNEINRTFSIPSTVNSDELIKNIRINCSDLTFDKSIEITKDSEVIKELIVKEENKYTPVDIYFLNKYGQLDTLVFFKDNLESLKTESKEFQTNIGQPIDGVHQFETYEKNGNTEFKINSGWVKESNNEIFKQLFLSKKVWHLKDEVFIPLNLESSNLQYQTKKRDKLINYEVNFKYAFNEVNDI